MHIVDKLLQVFEELNWIYTTEHDGSIRATKHIQFKRLAGTISDGTRLVDLRIDSTGRWLTAVDGWEEFLADVDLREFENPYLAIGTLLAKAY